MIKILHLIYDHINNPWVGGGGSVRVYEIYKRLSKKGYIIKVISGKYPKAFDYNVNDNFRYEFKGITKNYILSVFSYAVIVTNFLKKHYKEYDIVIEDFAPWNPIFSYRFQKKTRVILQLHQKEGYNILKRYYFFSLPFYILERYYPKSFYNIITISDNFKKIFGVNSFTIPNGIEPKFLKEKICFNGDYALYLGRIDYFHKGLDILIKSFSLTNIPLIIIGKGKDSLKLLYDIKNLKNVKNEKFLQGKYKIKIMKKAKFLILPSRYEGVPLILLEAAALGKPIIVSDIPELKYVVDNGFGISFKCGDAEDLKRKVEYLWNNHDLIEKLGKNGREYAKNFTWDKIADLYEEYLLKVYKDFYKK